jgi:hypothetical protein
MTSMLTKDSVSVAVSSLVQLQTRRYAPEHRAATLARIRNIATAGPQDAWDVGWDCNTDACEIEDLYRKNGKSVVILDKVLEHPHATPNAIRAVCNLLWRDHGKHLKPEIASKAYTCFKYIKNDATWIREMSRVGNIRAALEVEFDRVKSLVHDAGDLGLVLEEAERKLGKYDPATHSLRRVAASAVIAAHVDDGAETEIVIARRRMVKRTVV